MDIGDVGFYNAKKYFKQKAAKAKQEHTKEFKMMNEKFEKL